ncbi:carbohydrate ABC transporter permease [Streptomyces sp. NPDC048590]|uniref:carbohydrate ABC transporter permease n=1 Tax=Streptomyces sp. NPDC048590 TaxID=3365574 RepID=UPI00371F8E00
MSAPTSAPSGTLAARPRPGRTPLRRRLGAVCWWIAAVLVAASAVLPLLWTLSTSLKPAGEIITDGVRFIPRHFTWGNYSNVFHTVPMVRYALNSLLIGAAGVASNLFLGSLAGYTLARLQLRGKRIITSAYVASMMIPPTATMVPLFVILRHFPLFGGNNLLGSGGSGVLNTYWAVILPGAVGAFAVFFMKQTFDSLPPDLADAARIDGASEFRIYFRIYLPLARAALAVLGILTFQAGWNSFMWPLIVLSKPSKMTVQVGLSGFVTNYSSHYGPLMAGTIVASLPVLAIFLFAQRWVVEGLATSGGK